MAGFVAVAEHAVVAIRINETFDARSAVFIALLPGARSQIAGAQPIHAGLGAVAKQIVIAIGVG